MPERKSVPKLLMLSENCASKIVLEFLSSHSTSTCKYCTNTSKVNVDCHDLINLRNELLELPTCNRKSIFKNVTSATDFRSISFEYIYFHTFLFEDKDLRVNYESNGKQRKDVQFFSSFAKNVKQFTCKLPKVNATTLVKNFIAATNLKSVEFDNLTETLLEIFGKWCPQLTSIKGKLITNSDTYNSAFRKLVFQDPEKQLQRNKCCNTLECFDVKVDYRYKEVFVEQLGILLHNVPNLKNFGSQIRLEDVTKLLKPENQTPLKLQSMVSTNLTLDVIEITKTYFPELTRFYVFIEQSLNVLRALNTISSITNLSVVTLLDTSDLCNGLLHSEWSNLLSLFIHGPFEDLDLSLFAEKLPSLESLEIKWCRGVICNGKTYFKNLKIVQLEGYTADADFSGILSFSKTVVCLTALNDSSNENTPVIPELLDEVFPHLKTLRISPTPAYNIETVKSIFENCPKLESCSCLLGGKTSDEYRRIADYLEENNIDCIVE